MREVSFFSEAHCPRKLFDYSAVIYGARLPSVETKITDKLFTIPAE